MLQSGSESFRERVAAVGISQDALAALAGVHPSDVSRHSKSYHVAPARVARMAAALAELEELVAADPLKLDLSDVNNVRLALARLAEKRAAAEHAESAVAPYVSREAAAPYDTDMNMSSASEILATPLEK